MRYLKPVLGLAGLLLIFLALTFPTTLGLQMESSARLATITIGGGAPTSITLQLSSVDYTQCFGCTVTYQEVQFGNTFQLGGTVNVQQPNLPLNIQVNIGSSQYNVFNAYVTDSQGNWGWKANGGTGDGNLAQLKTDGLYLKGSKAIAQSISSGTTVAFKAAIGSVWSNEADAKIVGSGVQPTGTVTLKDGTGTMFTLTASSSITAQSPLCFQVAVTQGADNVQSANLQYWVYNGITPDPGTGIQTSPLTENTPVCGLPSDQNSYYGQLSLQPGVYTVKVNIIPKQGQNVILLSIEGYFGVSPPTNLRYSYAVIFGLIGLIVLAGAIFLPRKTFNPVGA